MGGLIGLDAPSPLPPLRGSLPSPTRVEGEKPRPTLSFPTYHSLLTTHTECGNIANTWATSESVLIHESDRFPEVMLHTAASQRSTRPPRSQKYG